MRDKIIKVLGTHPPLKAIKIAPLVCERLENVHRVLRTLVSAKAIHVTGNGFYSLNREAPPPKPPRVIQPTKKKGPPRWRARPKPVFKPSPKQQQEKLDQQAFDMNNRRKASKRPIDVIKTNQQESPVEESEKQKLLDQADDLAKTLNMPVVNIPPLSDWDVKRSLAERLMAGMTPEMAVQFEQWVGWTAVVLAFVEVEKGE